MVNLINLNKIAGDICYKYFESLIFVPVKNERYSKGLLFLADRKPHLVTDVLLQTIEKVAKVFSWMLQDIERGSIKKTNTRRLNFLVVDDNKNIANSISKVISKMGYSAENACNGKEALLMLEKKKFDGVITDISMPVMGGLELADKIYEKWGVYAPRVILVSGEFSKFNARDYLKKGVVCLLSKPFAVEDLKDIINYFF